MKYLAFFKISSDKLGAPNNRICEDTILYIIQKPTYPIIEYKNTMEEKTAVENEELCVAFKGFLVKDDFGLNPN